MREVVDGVFHWNAHHPNIGGEVSSYYVEPARALLNPMAPDEVVEWLEARDETPELIILTNRHHYRDSDRLRERFDCRVLCHRAGLHEFEGGPEVEGFAFGDDLATKVRALEIDAISEEETALLIDLGHGALAVGDALVNRDGIRFVSDRLLGESPETVKEGIRRAFSRQLDRRFDALLFAHGDPIVEGGKQALTEFIESG